MKNKECQTQSAYIDCPNLSESEKLTIRMRNTAQRTIAIKISELFGIIFKLDFYVGIGAQYLVNYDHRKINKHVKHEILIHSQFNINLLLKIERK